MATQFDPIKALREEIEGLTGVQKTITTMERRAEMEMGEAEARLNAVRKLSGFCTAELDRKRDVLKQLETEKERQGG